MTSCVVFDLDGTLVEFPREHLFSTARRVFSTLGIAEVSEAELSRCFAEFDFFSIIPEPQRAACAELLSRELERVGHPLLQPFADTREVLTTLKNRGFSLAIATARVVPLEELQRSLAEIELSHYFDCIIPRSPSSLDWKDKVPQLEYVCQSLGVAAQELCFVGDIPSDVESAKRFSAGVTVAAVTGGILPSLLAASEPDHIINSLSELLEILA